MSDASPRTWPDEHPELLPFMPLVLTAWEDGVLTPAEFRALSAHLDGQDWLDDEARAALSPWLDGEDPPEPASIAPLHDRIRQAGIADSSGPPRTLTDLGLALARAEGHGDLWGEDAVHGLRALESALGVVGRDAAARAAGGAAESGRARRGDGRPMPGFDAGSLSDFLEDDGHRDLRREVLEALAEPILRIPPGTPYPEYRERVLAAVGYLAERGWGSLAYPEEHGGRGDPGAALAAFEALAFGDLSVLIKFGVQFGLFGGSVVQLGTRRHHEAYLRDIGSLALPGCYAMTETGHGSNVRDLETTATYDPSTDELVVHTPHERAGKDWIGNAAAHGRMATVFARLVVDGDDHGVHALLVPIRDAEGDTLAGVRIEDRGLKEGLNGVDNGRIWFDSVRVPRDNLLDRFARIDPGGVYRSPITSRGRRFFTMLGTLVAGRISIAAASVSAAKTGLAIAVRYSDRRRQFGPEGGDEVPILDYLVHQRLLLPRLATTYGLHFAVRDLQRRYADPDTPSDDPELEVRAAGLKAYASWHCVDTLQACREACGGQGYLAANRFAALKADTDVFTTFEGANAVLVQLVAKGLLSRFRHEMGDLRFWGVMKFVAERAQTTLAELNPVVVRRTDPDHLTDPTFLHAAFSYREERLLRSVAMRLKRRIDDGMDTFQATTEVQDHLVELAQAHVERVILDAFQAGVVRAPNPGLSEALAPLSALYGLSTMERHSGWYQEVGYIEGNKSRAIRTQVNELLGEVRDCARLYVDAFGIPDDVLAAPAAL